MSELKEPILTDTEFNGHEFLCPICKRQYHWFFDSILTSRKAVMGLAKYCCQKEEDTDE